MNAVKQYNAIQEARRKADYVLVIVHGGYEHYQLPSLRMVNLYRFFIEVGADAVINHHQHCFSSYEWHKGHPIFYGLGNFCFDINPVKKEDKWNYGYMVVLDLGWDKVEAEIIPYSQCGNDAKINVRPSGFPSETLEEICKITVDTERLISDNERYFTTSDRLVSLILDSNKNRLLRVLGRLLPVRYKAQNEYLLKLYNMVLCESHRDKLFHYLESKYKEMYEK